MYKRAAAPRNHLALRPNQPEHQKTQAYTKDTESGANPIHSGAADFCLAATPALTHSPGSTTGCMGRPQCWHMAWALSPCQLKRQVQLLSITLSEGAQAVTSTWQKPHLLCLLERMWPLRQSSHENTQPSRPLGAGSARAFHWEVWQW